MLIKNCEVRKVISKVVFYIIIYYPALHLTQPKQGFVGEVRSSSELNNFGFLIEIIYHFPPGCSDESLYFVSTGVDHQFRN